MDNETKGKFTKGRWIANGFSVYAFVNNQISHERKILDIALRDFDNPSDVPIEELQGNVDFCVEAMNQCQQVNESNPLVVAENIKEMVEALKDLVQGSGHVTEDSVGLIHCPSEKAMLKAFKVLAKISEVKDNEHGS